MSVAGWKQRDSETGRLFPFLEEFLKPLGDDLAWAPGYGLNLKRLRVGGRFTAHDYQNQERLAHRGTVPLRAAAGFTEGPTPAIDLDCWSPRVMLRLGNLVRGQGKKH